MALKFHSIPVTALQQNCSLVWCDQTKKAVIIDPGGDIEALISQINLLQLIPITILLTHGHFDHIAGAPKLADYFKIDIIGAQCDDQFLFESLPAVCMQYNFPVTPAFEPTRWVTDGEHIVFGDEYLQVIHTPGHTPGHVCYYSQSSQLIFVGDVLFQNAIGRTDFPRGDFKTLIHSIKTKLWPLGDVTFISGHGASSTFFRERQSNPFVADHL